VALLLTGLAATVLAAQAGGVPGGPGVAGSPGSAGLPTGDGTVVAFALVVFGSLLAMINPLGALTIFVGLTADQTDGQRRRTALRACITAALILLVFAVFGTAILRFFGITTYAFRVAGGILFFGIGWDMLQAKRSRAKTTPEEEEESAARSEVAVVPLGIPTLAGPGAITTVIALTGQSTSALETGMVYAGILAVLFVSWVALLGGPAILRMLGQTGINVSTRLMGLLVMVVGVQFVLDGLRTAVLEILGGAA
jgi:multiple antibiotic resistance protein